MEQQKKKKIKRYADISLETPFELIRKDIREAAVRMSKDEARYLVDLYYQVQDNRLAAGNQARSLNEDEPNTTIKWTFNTMFTIEDTLKKALDDYSNTQHMGRWAKGIVGIGPVLSAGLLAHIDVEKTHGTAGSVWRYAGIDPTSEWKKGEKRPWNATLKVLCWKIGESFVKVSGNPRDYYGKLYKERKAMEQAKNEALEFKDQAKAKLEKFNIGKTTDAYKAYSVGKLPPAHIHARARRWTVKVFLCHYFEEAYRDFYKKEPPVIYSIAMLGHTHKIEAPEVEV